MGAYLAALADEAEQRGYRFDRSKIDTPPALAPSTPVTTPAPASTPAPTPGGTDGPSSVAPVSVRPIPVTEGQVAHEWQHLLAKLAERSPELHATFREVVTPEVHPLFQVVPGPIEDWERP